jgi:hypothetical protein
MPEAGREMGAEMKKKQHITAFYMEMLVLITVFIVVILILTKVFALSRQQSAKARILTNAVCLAENTAETAAASPNEETFLMLFGREGNACMVEEDGHRIYQARYDDKMAPAAEGNFLVNVEWIPEDGTEGDFVTSRITVYWNGSAEPIYTLETGMYLR